MNEVTFQITIPETHENSEVTAREWRNNRVSIRTLEEELTKTVKQLLPGIEGVSVQCTANPFWRGRRHNK